MVCESVCRRFMYRNSITGIRTGNLATQTHVYRRSCHRCAAERTSAVGFALRLARTANPELSDRLNNNIIGFFFLIFYSQVENPHDFYGITKMYIIFCYRTLAAIMSRHWTLVLYFILSIWIGIFSLSLKYPTTVRTTLVNNSKWTVQYINLTGVFIISYHSHTCVIYCKIWQRAKLIHLWLLWISSLKFECAYLCIFHRFGNKVLIFQNWFCFFYFFLAYFDKFYIFYVILQLVVRWNIRVGITAEDTYFKIQCRFLQNWSINVKFFYKKLYIYRLTE